MIENRFRIPFECRIYTVIYDDSLKRRTYLIRNGFHKNMSHFICHLETACDSDTIRACFFPFNLLFLHLHFTALYYKYITEECLKKRLKKALYSYTILRIYICHLIPIGKGRDGSKKSSSLPWGPKDKART